MLRNFTIIFIIAALFGTFLIIRPYILRNNEKVEILDRLPDADFMAILNPLQLANEAKGMMFKHKIPYRDFVSGEFLLSQAKGFGVNFQIPVYAFGNQTGEFGLLAELTDSSKVLNGVKKLMHFFNIDEKIIDHKKVYKFKDFNGYLTYSKDFILFYIGEAPKTTFNRVFNAKANQVSPNWMNFSNSSNENGKSLILYSRFKEFSSADIHHIISYPYFDSTNMYITTMIKFNDSLPFKMKEDGRGILSNSNSSKELQLHVDPNYLQRNVDHPINALLAKISKKIHFPYWDFIKAWKGDLSFQQGGWVTVQEEFIESEMDDDFNITEIIRKQDVKVPGFNCFVTLDNSKVNIQKSLEKRGLLTLQEDGYRFVFSPPLKYYHNQLEHLYYATKAKPKIQDCKINFVRWPINGTIYNFHIDSLANQTIYTTLSFSPEKILMNKLKN